MADAFNYPFSDFVNIYNVWLIHKCKTLQLSKLCIEINLKDSLSLRFT